MIARAAEVRPHRGDIQDLAQKYGRTLVGQLPANARNSSARDAYRELGLAPQGFPTETELGRLEKLINPQNKMLHMAVWVERAVRSQGPVCRVEIDGEPMGTGFLVGPSAVLTNHHVVDQALDGTQLRSKVRLRFDYKELRDGTILSGTLVEARGLLSGSPATDGELNGSPEKEDPSLDQLDFALLETEGTPGSEPIRVTGAADGSRRGWIHLPDGQAVPDSDPFAPDQPVLIAQHPSGKPLSLAIEWQSMIGPNASPRGCDIGPIRRRVQAGRRLLTGIGISLRYTITGTRSTSTNRGSIRGSRSPRSESGSWRVGTPMRWEVKSIDDPGTSQRRHASTARSSSNSVTPPPRRSTPIRSGNLSASSSARSWARSSIASGRSAPSFSIC